MSSDTAPELGGDSTWPASLTAQEPTDPSLGASVVL